MICAHAEPSVRGHVMILRRKCARTRYGKLLDFLGESIALLLRRAQIDDARTHWIIALKISGTDHFLLQRIIKKNRQLTAIVILNIASVTVTSVDKSRLPTLTLRADAIFSSNARAFTPRFSMPRQQCQRITEVLASGMALFKGKIHLDSSPSASASVTIFSYY